MCGVQYAVRVCDVFRYRGLFILLSFSVRLHDLSNSYRLPEGRAVGATTEKELPGLVIILDERRAVNRSSSPLLSIASQTKWTWLDQNCFGVNACLYQRHWKTGEKSYTCVWSTAERVKTLKESHPREMNKLIRGSRLNHLATKPKNVGVCINAPCLNRIFWNASMSLPFNHKDKRSDMTDVNAKNIWIPMERIPRQIYSGSRHYWWKSKQTTLTLASNQRVIAQGGKMKWSQTLTSTST